MRARPEARRRCVNPLVTSPSVRLMQGECGTITIRTMECTSFMHRKRRCLTSYKTFCAIGRGGLSLVHLPKRNACNYRLCVCAAQSIKKTKVIRNFLWWWWQFPTMTMSSHRERGLGAQVQVTVQSVCARKDLFFAWLRLRVYHLLAVLWPVQ